MSIHTGQTCIYCVYLVFGFSLTAFAPFCSTDSLPPDAWHTVHSQGSGNILLCYVPSEGFAYYDSEGKLTGVTAEIFRDFVTWVQHEYDIDLTVQYKRIDNWTEFYFTVKESPSGTFGMGNVTITQGRKSEIDFSPAYLTNIAVLITNEETPELSSLPIISEEFGHLRALAFAGTLHEDRIQQIRTAYFRDLEIHHAHSNDEIIEATTLANSYFAYIDIYNYWRAREQGAPLRRHSIADEPSEQFGFIMPYNSDWTPIITEFFETDNGYINTERYRDILEKHLGSQLATLLEEARLKGH